MKFAIYQIESFPRIFFGVSLSNPKIFAWAYTESECEKAIKEKIIASSKGLENIEVPDSLPEDF